MAIFFSCFWKVFEVNSISAAWPLVEALKLNFTNFLGNFKTIYISWSVVIRKFIFGIEFTISGNFYYEKALCAYTMKVNRNK